MSYWFSKKNKNGTEVTTSSSSPLNESDNSWLSSIGLAITYTLVIGIVFCVLIPKIFPNLTESIFLLVSILVLSFGAFLWLLRRKKA